MPYITSIDAAQAEGPKGAATLPPPDLKIVKPIHIGITITEQQASALRTRVCHTAKDSRLTQGDCLSGCVAATLTRMNGGAAAINELVTVMDVSHPLYIIYFDGINKGSSFVIFQVGKTQL
jgi:hypothetical protein